jgi:hypothetical protein
LHKLTIDAWLATQNAREDIFSFHGNTYLKTFVHSVAAIKTKSPTNFVLVTKYYPGDKIKKNYMGRVCSTYWVENRCIQGCGGKPGEKIPL